MNTIAVAANDTAGVSAQLSLANKYSVSDYDYVAVAVAGSGSGDYITYEYNSEKKRSGTIRIAHTEQTRAALRLVLRYFDAQSK